jgi:hypothetical protein
MAEIAWKTKRYPSDLRDEERAGSPIGNIPPAEAGEHYHVMLGGPALAV